MATLRLKVPAEFKAEGWTRQDLPVCSGWHHPTESKFMNDEMFLALTEAILRQVEATFASGLETFTGPTPDGRWWTWYRCLFTEAASGVEDSRAPAGARCECGADKHGFTGHMKFCPKWA
jgi:hypothetical protein